jgi:hypothetical protein
MADFKGVADTAEHQPVKTVEHGLDGGVFQYDPYGADSVFFIDNPAGAKIGNIVQPLNDLFYPETGFLGKLAGLFIQVIGNCCF